jgi:hypothetical protein
MGIISWLVAVGCLLIGGAIGLWGLTEISKSIAIWFVGVPGAVFLVVAAGLELQKFVETPKVEQKNSNTDRAWISLRLSIEGPLSYDANGWDAGPRWHIPIRYQLDNAGNTPALHVDFLVDIRPFLIPYLPQEQIKNGVPQGTGVPGTDSGAELKKLCQTAQTFAQMDGGQTIFRGESRVGIFHLNGNPALFDAAKVSPGFSGNILILACATYRVTGDEEAHRTAESIALFIPNQKIDLNSQSISKDQLKLIHQPMGGSFAD